MRPLQVLLLGTAALIVLIILRFLLARPRRLRHLPHSKRLSLLSAGELDFYSVLLRAAPYGITVFVKIRLMDVVTVDDDDWSIYGAKGSGMHVDFVLADSLTTKPRMVIELDDRTHARLNARRRDAFKDAAVRSAGMPVLRVTAAARYDATDLRTRIAALLEDHLE